MKKGLQIFFLIAALGLLWASALPAATINVPGPYGPTIQAAINAANLNDIIVVAAGTYAERITINRSLELRGAQYGIDPTPGGARTNPANESIIDISALPLDGNPNVAVEIPSGVTHVVVDGFTLIGSPTFHWADESVVRCWDDNLGIQNNIIDGYYGILYKGNDHSTFSRNRETVNKLGITVQGGPATYVTISGNTIAPGGNPASDAAGIYLTGDSYTSVTGNTVSGFTGSQAVGGSSHDHMIVSGNTFTGNKKGISFWGNTTFITITGNTVSNSLVNGIEIKGADLTISGNFINNNAVGILVDFNSIPTERVAIFNNDLSGNATWAVQVMPAVVMTVDASANWWGAYTPSGVAAKITGTIDYTPWLDGGSDTSGDPGFQGDFSVLDVGAAGSQTGATGRIQEAIGLVSGSTINVAAGLYNERVIVNKAVILKGATNGVSKKGFVVPPLYAYDPLTQSIIKPSTPLEQEVVTIAADNVVFDGFVVANQVCATGGVYQDLVGIDQSLAAPTGIQILNNVLGPNTNTASQDGSMGRCGVTVYGPHSAGPVKLIVRGNKIFDSKGNGAGIMIVGPYGPTYHGGAVYTNFFSGSVIENNEITGNHRSGIELAGGVQGGAAPADYFIIRDNLVTNNGWYALADKDNLKYGNGITFIRAGSDRLNADASGSRYLSFESNTITGNEKNGFYFGPKNKDIFSTGNIIQNNGLGTGGYSLWDGVRVDLAESYYAPGTAYTDYGYLTDIPFSNGTIGGNGSDGYRVIQTPTLGSVSALSNYWGAQSGPYHPTLNPSGTGNAVSDNVLFEPWTGKLGVTVAPVATLTNCTTPQTVTFHIEQAGTPTDEVRGYEVTFQIDPTYVTVAHPATDILEGTFLKSVGTTQFYAASNGGGVYTVSCAILGGSHGGIAPGDLFSVLLTPVAQGTSAIAMTSIKVRDLANAPLSASVTGGSIRVDCTAPTMEAITPAGGGWYNAAPVLTHFKFNDDLNLDLAQYNYDGGAWVIPPIFSGIDAASWDGSPWTLPGFGGLSEGSHTINFRVKDDAGNWNTVTYSWQFNKDTVAPAPPTSFVALPGNQKVHLTWANPTGDPTFVGVEIRRVAWGDYPEYGTPGTGAPSYPADHNGGTYVTLAAGTAYDDNPLAPRDIYYYAAFSKDLAGNYSVLGTTAKDRSTNYWLGDVDPALDGYVNTNDLTFVFSAAFGTVAGGHGWNNTCDFGPTDDWSRLGIPLPDNKIDFEDLMIFSMNWGNVTPAGLGTFVANHVVEDLASLVKFDVVSIDENTISIVLRNRAQALKGVRVVVNVSGADLLKVDRGSVFAGRSDLFYGTLPATAGDADICAAALGVGTPFTGSGEIARLVVKPAANSSAVVTIKTVDLRNVDNEKTEINAPEQHETPFVPKATALMQNFPNPFNPVTTLTFDVAQTGNVTIAVYDVSGRLLVTLLNARVEVGRHTVEWNGKNANGSLVPSGIYFYRMKTAGYEATKKMILVR